jgi:hypothetical protein
MAKPFQVEHARSIAVIVAVAGIILSAVSMPDLLGVATILGDWSWWTFAIGLIMFVIGIYLLIVYLRNVTAFEELMQQKSKAEFVRRQDDAEYLAWRLPSKFEVRLVEKKKEFNVK